jgi:hypothetical protein
MVTLKHFVLFSEKVVIANFNVWLRILQKRMKNTTKVSPKLEPEKP